MSTIYKQRTELAQLVERMQAERDVRVLEGLVYKASRHEVMEATGWERDAPRRDAEYAGSRGPGQFISRSDDYWQGRCLPLYDSTLDLEELRGFGRLLAATSETAQAILSSLGGYTVGMGLTFAVESRKKNRDTSLAGMVQDAVDEFLDENDFLGELDRSEYLGSVIDGERLLWLRERGDSAPLITSIGGEHIAEPSDPRSVEDYTGEPGLCWRFGVAADVGDASRVHGYFVDWFGQGGESWDYVPESESVFLKRNTPRQAKRGVSDFAIPYRTLDRSSKLLDRIVLGATIQASIAYIRKVSGDSSADAIQRALANTGVSGSITGYTPTGRATSVTGEYFQGGKIITSSADHMHGPMGSPNGPAYVGVLQAGLRMVGSRWSMPEYMISGDASNANYASTLAATSPFVLRTKAEQGTLCRRYRDLAWKAIGMMAESGRFGAGYTLAELQRALDLKVTAPSPEVQDPQKDEAVYDAQQKAGVLSAKTRAGLSGLDYEQEVANGAKALDVSALISGPQGLNDPSTGEAVTGLNGAQVTAAIDVLKSVSIGSLPEVAAIGLLAAIGLDPSKAASIARAASAVSAQAAMQATPADGEPFAESRRVESLRFSLMENCGTGAGGLQPGNDCAASGSLADTAISKGWSKKVLRQKAEAAGLNPDDVQRLRAEKEQKRNPSSVNPKQSEEQKAAAEKAKAESFANAERLAAESRQASRSAAAAIESHAIRLRDNAPEVFKQAELSGMLADRTPRGAKAYADAAISWNHHDPSTQGVNWSVQQLKKEGASLKQRGNNNSWYGKTADGRDVRVSDHIGKEPHEIDVIVDAENPPTKEQLAKYLSELTDNG